MGIAAIIGIIQQIVQLVQQLSQQAQKNNEMQQQVGQQQQLQDQLSQMQQQLEQMQQAFQSIGKGGGQSCGGADMEQMQQALANMSPAERKEFGDTLKGVFKQLHQAMDDLRCGNTKGANHHCEKAQEGMDKLQEMLDKHSGENCGCHKPQSNHHQGNDASLMNFFGPHIDVNISLRA